MSFTFDDVPESAVASGLPILDEYDTKATFYACTEVGEVAPSRPTLDLDAIAELSNQGHEIGCHTASHLRVEQDSLFPTLRDCARNRQQLREATNGRWPESFSFPFGVIPAQAKPLLNRSYRSMRSTRPGVNRGTVDLGCLASEALYAASFDFERLLRQLATLRNSPGWIILYTHGVDEAPALDASSALLRRVLEACQRFDVDVATVHEVLNWVEAPMPYRGAVDTETESADDIIDLTDLSAAATRQVDPRQKHSDTAI